MAHTDQESRTNDGSDAAAKAPVKNNGKRLIHDNIGKEKCDQYPMFSLLQQIVYPLCVLLLWLAGVFRYDLEVDTVLSHEASRISYTRFLVGREKSSRNG